MDLLVIGGTRFVGRHLVEEALRRGHHVALFNRGSQAGLFPQLELLRGDRDRPEDLELLRGRRWDAVIDTCGYTPRQVRASAGVLAGSVGRYAFVSSISVYARHDVAHQDEEAPLGELSAPTEEVTAESYGPLKVLCERAAEETLPGRVLVLRPGLVAGPFDPTDRFTYWVERVARGGEVLAPGGLGAPVQWIDARDLATFTLDRLEREDAAVYNLVTPADQHTLGGLLEACRAASSSDATFTWVAESFLLEQNVGPWMELPLWVPGDDARFLRTSSDRAATAGLRTRPVRDTVEAVLAWSRSRPAREERRAGLRPDRERELLAAWHLR